MNTSAQVVLLMAMTVSSYAAPAQQHAVETGDVAPVSREQAFINKRVTAVRIDERSRAPVIDGVLDDRIWQSIEPAGGLHQIQPAEFAPATENTEFRIAYDADTLYVAVQLYSGDPGMVVALQPVQGKAFESDDQLHITLDPFNRDRDGYFFQVNANGVRREALLTNSANTGFNADWEAIWDAASSINADGWASEIAIPFKSISFDPSIDTWGFNIGRVIRKKGEFLAWSSRGADVWEMGPNVAGDLGPIRDIHQGMGLDIQLSGVLTRTEQYRPDTTDTDAEPSLDLFYKPDPSLTLAATLNTDFSATEVDDRIVNLTRFSVLFPEKRDFFLQDANQFSFADLNDNGMPYFSRSIGLDETGQPVPLDGGVKLSGRFNDYNIGALAIRQEASGEREDAGDLYVVRGTRNILSESTVGFIYTRGNPVADTDNRATGVDFNYNNSNAFGGRLVQASAWYQQVKENVEREDNAAYGLRLAYPSSRYSLAWNFMQIGRHFNPALGFVNRKDIRRHTLNGGFRDFFDGGRVRSYNPTFEIEHIENTAGVKETERFQVRPLYFDTRAGDQIGLSYIDQFEFLDEPFNMVDDLVVPPGDYDFDRVNLSISSSIARRFHASVEYERGDFYNGERVDRTYGLGWRPWRRLLLTADYEIADLELPSGEFTTRLTRLGSELAINPDWAWLLFAQYDNVTDRLSINSRLRWLPRAGRELYFVINKGRQRLDDGSFQSTSDEYTLKAGYTLRF